MISQDSDYIYLQEQLSISRTICIYYLQSCNSATLNPHTELIENYMN